MLLENKIADVVCDFASQFMDQDSTYFTDLNLMTDVNQEGNMEVRIGHSLDPNKISMQLLNLQPCSQQYTFELESEIMPKSTIPDSQITGQHISCNICSFRTSSDLESQIHELGHSLDMDILKFIEDTK